MNLTRDQQPGNTTGSVCERDFQTASVWTTRSRLLIKDKTASNRPRLTAQSPVQSLNSKCSDRSFWSFRLNLNSFNRTTAELTLLEDREKWLKAPDQLLTKWTLWWDCSDPVSLFLLYVCLHIFMNNSVNILLIRQQQHFPLEVDSFIVLQLSIVSHDRLSAGETFWNCWLRQKVLTDCVLGFLNRDNEETFLKGSWVRIKSDS